MHWATVIFSSSAVSLSSIQEAILRRSDNVSTLCLLGKYLSLETPVSDRLMRKGIDKMIRRRIRSCKSVKPGYRFIRRPRRFKSAEAESTLWF